MMPLGRNELNFHDAYRLVMLVLLVPGQQLMLIVWFIKNISKYHAIYSDHIIFNFTET